jgi:hypothetical protein
MEASVRSYVAFGAPGVVRAMLIVLFRTVTKHCFHIVDNQGASIILPYTMIVHAMLQQRIESEKQELPLYQ